MAIENETMEAEEKTAFVSGNFNLLHPGHLRLLRFASEIGAKLVVAVSPDGTPGVSVPAVERLQNVSALEIVSKALILEQPLEDCLNELRPDFVVKGKEFENEDNVEEAVLTKYGGQLIFSSGEMQFSSLGILESEFQALGSLQLEKPPGFVKRHRLDVGRLRLCLDSFKSTRMLVVGDLIVDDYIDCEPLGMSQEDPTIVVSPLKTSRFVGGAGIVSAHARGLGAQVQYVTVTGDDEIAEYSKEFFVANSVDYHPHVDKTRPTTLKQRYRANGKTMLRVNHLRQHDITKEQGDLLVDDIMNKIDDTDIILFSDFNYGCLPQFIVEDIAEIAHSKGIPMCADSQASSQQSDISRFEKMLLVTPTEREARLALQDPRSGLAVLASNLAEKAGAENVIITLGAEGILIRGITDGEERIDRLPALNNAAKDVAGAGDSLFTTVALALANDASIWEAAYLGSIAAACQTNRIGNTALTIEDIIDHLY